MNKTSSDRIGKTAGRAVMVCTDKRGVFFGYAEDTNGDRITLTKARMCIYWSQATKGVLGLAAAGPKDGCRISPPVPAIELRGITCVVECSVDAAAAWETAPWS